VHRTAPPVPRAPPRVQPQPPRTASPPPTAAPAPAEPSPPAAAAPAAPAAPPATASPPAAISTGWQSSVAAWIEAHKHYPEAAQRRGEEGLVTVRFTVDREGHVLDVELVRASGSESIDQATRKLLEGATVPPLPASMTQTKVTLTVHVRYSLAE
jgi:protein TonB